MERLAPHTRWHCSIPTVAVLLLAVVAAAASVVRPAQSLAIVGGQRVPNNKAMAFVPPGAGATSAASVARRRSSVAAAPGRTAGQLNSHTSTTIHTSGTASGRLMRLFPGGSPGHSSVSLSATAVAPALSIEAPPHTEIPGVDSPASSSSSPSSLGQHVLDGVKLPGPLMPVGDVILAERRDVEEKTAGGLILPNDVREQHAIARILAVGPGTVNPDTGERVPLGVAPGDWVILNQGEGKEFNYDGKPCLLLWADDALATIKNSSGVLKARDVRPIADTILVQVPCNKEESTSSGLIVAGREAAENPTQGRVLAVGPGAFDRHNQRVPMEVETKRICSEISASRERKRTRLAHD
eukprot:GHVT01102251.1.p1 GENE.GHVT01102251.1~~GHVT01102251.1.p1  ORF type:complete len:354 (+),score=62.25 GHVT01102251.1:366-1427(+)